MTEMVPLRALASCNDESLPGSFAVERLIRYIEIGDVSEAEGITNVTEIAFGEAPSRARRVVKTGDVLVSTVRTYLRSVAAVGPQNDGDVASTGFAVLRAKHIHPPYLKYAVLNREFLNEVVARSTGVSYPAINASELLRIKVPAPAIPVQQSIAEYLDRETERLRTFIAKNDQLIELLKERRAASVDAAFESLVAPKMRLKQVAQIRAGITLSGEHESVQPEWPYVRVANVQVGRIDLTHIKTLRLATRTAKQYLLSAGDVLITEGGDPDKLGRGAIWDGQVEPMLHQNHVFAVQPSPMLDSRYLMHWLDSSSARAYFEATARQTTNLASTSKTIVGELRIMCPPVEEQRRVSSELDAKLSSIDASVSTAKRAIGLARERRTAIISAAVSGAIDLTRE